MTEQIQIGCCAGCAGCAGTGCDTEPAVGLNPAAIAAAYEKAKKVFGKLKKAYSWLTEEGGPIDYLTGGPQKRRRARRDARRLELAAWCYSVALARWPKMFFTDKKKFRAKLKNLILSPIVVPGTDITGAGTEPDIPNWIAWTKTGISGDWMDQLKKMFVSTDEGRELFQELKREYHPKYQTHPEPRAAVRLTARVPRATPPTREESDAQDRADAKEVKRAKDKARKRRRRKKKEREARAARRRRREARERRKKPRRKKKKLMVPSATAEKIETRKRSALEAIKELFRRGKTKEARAAARKLARV